MPETYHIRLTPRSSSDLQGVFDYISQGSPENAAKMIETLLAAIDGLTTLPYRFGVPRSGSVRGRAIRVMPVRPYLVRYRVDERNKTVYILRVRHGARHRP